MKFFFNTFKEYLFPIAIICVLVFLCIMVGREQIIENKRRQAKVTEILQQTYERGYLDCAKDQYQKKPLKAKLVEYPDGSKNWVYDNK